MFPLYSQINGTNNTQMLHYPRENNLSHMVYYII